MSYLIYETSISIDMDDPFITGFNYILCDCSAGDINIYLYATIWAGLNFQVLRVDSNTSNTLTLSAKTGTFINGASSVSLNVGQMTELVAKNSTDWNAPIFNVSY